MVIGKADNKEVVWNEHSATIEISDTFVTITGAVTKEQAIDICKKNIKNFEC